MKTVVLAVLVCIVLVSAFDVPTPGREWYIGGSFSKAYNADGSSVDASNIVAWKGSENKWRTMSTGTNGAVNFVHTDTCRTVYVGGAFTTASGLATGPVAKWTLNANAWAPIFEGNNPFGAGAVVNSISTDCANLDIKNLNPLKCVPCDVYVAGSFNITVNGVTGYNVAKWDATSKAWDLLAPTGAGAPKAADKVYTVYKKAYGVTESAKFVWIGGNFDNGATSLKKYKLNDGAWDITSIPAFQGTIKTLYYNPGLFTTDEIYVGGSFNNAATGGTCTNVCKFDYKQNQFSQVGASNRPGPTGEVLSLQLSESNLYAAGSFTGTINYLSTIGESSAATNSWGAISNIAGITGPLSSITICNNADAGCSTGSIAMVGPNGFMSFYNAKSKNYEPFGNKTNGDVRTITSLYTIYSAAPLAQVSIFAAVVLMLLLLALF